MSTAKLKNCAGLVNANNRIKSNGQVELLLYANSDGASSPAFQFLWNVVEVKLPTIEVKGESNSP